VSLDPAALILRISESFGGMEYPGDECIVRDESGGDLESTGIKEALKGQHWRDLSFETLERLRTSLPFLSAEGYRFFLPAFMVMSIVDFARADGIPEEVVRSLTPPAAADVDRMRELAELHPEVQPFASGEWAQILETMQEAYGPSGALDSTFAERAAGFDGFQADVIRDFLEYMQRVHGEEFPGSEPEVALKRYWQSATRSSAD
jgi:hypothetical protein